VHQEGAVRHVDDPYPPGAADLVDDLLAVLLVARLERDVAGDGALADLDQVDGADCLRRPWPMADVTLPSMPGRLTISTRTIRL